MTKSNNEILFELKFILNDKLFNENKAWVAGDITDRVGLLIDMNKTTKEHNKRLGEIIISKNIEINFLKNELTKANTPDPIHIESKEIIRKAAAILKTI